MAHRRLLYCYMTKLIGFYIVIIDLWDTLLLHFLYFIINCNQNQQSNWKISDFIPLKTIWIYSDVNVNSTDCVNSMCAPRHFVYFFGAQMASARGETKRAKFHKFKQWYNRVVLFDFKRFIYSDEPKQTGIRVPSHICKVYKFALFLRSYLHLKNPIWIFSVV